ncbi:MAG: hypothetical protein JWQ01_4785 [Massilia sp.]|nr:hypothetical protein [Massilia sp.]
MSAPSPPIAEPLERRLLLATTNTLIKDIYPGAKDGSLLFKSDRNSTARAIKGHSEFYFRANDGTGSEPWVSDGTPDGTHPLVSGAGINATGNSGAGQFTAANGLIYFTANDGTGEELWQTDGTEAGTHALTAFFGGANPKTPVALDDDLIFFTYLTDSPGVYRTDPVEGIKFIAGGLGNPLGVAGTKLLYYTDTAGSPKKNLWTTDGNTAASFREIDAINSIPPITYNGVIYFVASQGQQGYELWRSDATNPGTHLVGKEINPGAGAFPRYFTISGGYLYFVADGGATRGNEQIYRTDGTTVTKITSLPGTDATVSNPIADLVDFNGTLYFTYAPANNQRSLYKLTGGKTPTDLGLAQTEAAGELTPVGDKLFFSARDHLGNSRLWSYDAAGARIEDDSTISPVHLTNVNGFLFYQAFTTKTGNELHGFRAGNVEELFTVRVKASTKSINEGQSVVFSTFVTGFPKSKLKFFWDWDGDGKLSTDGHKPAHLFRDNLKDALIRNVRVKVVAPDKSFKNGYLKIEVKNVAPAIKKLVIPSAYVPNIQMPFQVVVADPGKDDELNVTINWGQGNVQTYKPAANGLVSGTVSFPGTSSPSEAVNVRVEVEDHDNTGSFKKKLLTLTNVLNQPSSVVIGGTSAADNLRITPSTKPRKDGNVAINIVLNDNPPVTVIVSPTKLFYVSLADGNDRVFIDPSIKNPFQLFGGPGNDRYSLGGGPNTIIDPTGHNTATNAGPDDNLKKMKK